MSLNFSSVADLNPTKFITALFYDTAPDGRLSLPKHFGTEEERDDEFNTFVMSWSHNDLNTLINDFVNVYSVLREIAPMYDKLNNDPYQAKMVLDHPILVDYWWQYLKRPQWSGMEERLLDTAFAKQEKGEELSPKEEKLIQKYCDQERQQSQEILGGNCFAYDVHIHAIRLCKLINIGAPKIVIVNEARSLICFMALKDWAISWDKG